jgi:hypothetical protein
MDSVTNVNQKINSTLESTMPADRPAKTSTRPGSLPHRLIGLLFLAALIGSIWAMLNWQNAARQAELDRRAPVVFDLKADYCELSEGGRYMRINAPGVEPGDFFDTATGAKITVPLPPEVAARMNDGLWLRDETWIITEWPRAVFDNTPPLPTQGWLVDVAQGTVTDLTTLDSATRSEFLALAYEQIRTHLVRRGPGLVSPNGLYFASGLAISQWQGDVELGPRLNEYTGEGLPLGCLFGWRPDSSGYYFIEMTQNGHWPEPGPIRLMLVEPQ